MTKISKARSQEIEDVLSSYRSPDDNDIKDFVEQDGEYINSALADECLAVRIFLARLEELIESD
jgi:hypothetical protein